MRERKKVFYDSRFAARENLPSLELNVGSVTNRWIIDLVKLALSYLG